ncbi:ESX secretion-associated protein EspG [Amycolatopsis sp. NPDC059021]|uniref:ESX secretion-associated protein EspG n=1 Tax=Amycolatopsis sp. NPDC059021 TaxID=3346704 RepID=UPI0036724A47
MEVIDRPVVLPKPAFLTAWEMIDLGDPHPVIGTNLRYVTTDGFARRLHARTMELLGEHGLARNNRLNGLWRSTLRVIDRAESEYYGWSTFRDGTSCAVLIAHRGGAAVRVVVNDSIVIVEPVAPKWPATTLLDTLPEAPAAAVRTVSVPRRLFDDPNPMPASPLADPEDTGDVDYVKRVMAEPRDAVHQLYTARRADAGSRISSSPVTALDLTGRGRVLSFETGDEHVILKAATPRDFVLTLNTTHESL